MVTTPLPKPFSTRRPAGLALRGAAVSLFVALLPGVAGAQPMERTQTIGSLQERARAIATELEQLDMRTNALDEQYNNARYELERLREALGSNQAEVDAARAQLDANRADAQTYAVQAYIGSADDESDMIGMADDAAEASRRRTYLAARYGDSEAVIDGLVAAQKDLADRESALRKANDEIDAKVAELDRSKAQLAANIASRTELQESVQGQLAAALEAEQQRLARESEAKARAEAEAAAARAAAARRPQAVAVQAPVAGATARATAVVATPPVVATTPPPAGAPQAVQIALAQQGDPYRWAGSGPDAFDCSGLVMFAYKGIRSLPHSSRALRSMSRSISVDELQPGDLVFGGSPVHHVGIYIGDGQMVHAPHSGDVVKVSGIYSSSKPVHFGRL